MGRDVEVWLKRGDFNCSECSFWGGRGVRGVEVGLRVGKVVEAFEFVSDAFDLETALVPGIEDATCAPFPDSVVEIAVNCTYIVSYTGMIISYEL